MRLTWHLLLAALCAPLMGAESAPLDDATYAMVMTYGNTQSPCTFIFKDGHVLLPEAAPLVIARDSAGVLVTWQTVRTAAQSGAGFFSKITSLAMEQAAAGGAATCSAMASAGGGDQTMTTTYHAHLAADGTLTGSVDSVMGRIPGGSCSFTGHRIGPARAVRRNLEWWYRMTQSANDTLVETDAVDLDFTGAGGNSLGSGTIMIDGEGTSSSQNGDYKATCADGVATIALGPATAVFTDRGRTLTIGGKVFPLGSEHLTIRVPVHGEATVVKRRPLPAPLALDGRSFAVSVSAKDETRSDHMTFQGGRMDMITCEAIGTWTPYEAEQRSDGTHLHLHEDGGSTYGDLSLDITAIVAAGHLTGHGRVSRGEATVFAFDISGTDEGSAPTQP